MKKVVAQLLGRPDDILGKVAPAMGREASIVCCLLGNGDDNAVIRVRDVLTLFVGVVRSNRGRHADEHHHGQEGHERMSHRVA